MAEISPDTLNDVLDTIKSVSGSVQSFITTQQNQLGDLASSVVGGVQQKLGQAFADLGNLRDDLTSRITGGLTGLEQAVGSVVRGSQNAITDTLGNAFADVTRTLDNALGGLRGQLGNALTSIAQVESGARDTIAATLQNGLAGAQQTYQKITGDLANGLRQDLNGLATLQNQAQTAIVSGLQAGFSDLQTLTKTLDTQLVAAFSNLNPALGAIVGAIEKGTGLVSAAGSILAVLQGLVTNNRKGLLGHATDKQAVYQRILSGGYSDLPQAMTDLLDPPETGLFLVDLVASLGELWGGALLFMELARIYQRRPLQVFNALNQTEILTPEILATMVVQNVVPQDQAATIAGMAGLPASEFDRMVRVVGEPLARDELFALWNRGIIDESVVTQALLESRLKNKYIDAAKNLRFPIPPVADLVHFVVRHALPGQEGFEGVEGSAMPANFVALAQKVALDPTWARSYWAAHWNLPGVEQVFEMLHRSPETGVTLDTVKAYLERADISPLWRDRLIAISYAPFTRVDVRRMYKLKILDKAQVEQAYRDLGYNDARAKMLADFTQKYEDETGQQSPDMLERKQFDLLLDLFVENRRTENDLTAAAQSFGWSSEVVAAEIKIARLKKEHYDLAHQKTDAGIATPTLQREVVNALESLYVTGHRTADELTAAMRDFGWSDKTINLVLQVANLRKEVHYKPSRAEKVKETTVSAILDAMVSHVISPDDALIQLRGIGLSEVSARMEIATKQYQEAASLRKQIVTAIKDSFLNGDIDENGIAAKLGQYKFSADEISAYASLWTLEKGLRVKRVGEATLAAMVKHGVITPDEYATELKKSGYTDVQVTRFVKLRGGV